MRGKQTSPIGERLLNPYQIDTSLKPFQEDYKQALKKYPTFKDDISKVLAALESNPESGKAIPKFARRVWKIRVGVKGYVGKSGGYRLIYHVDFERKVITPMALYFKGETEKLPDHEVQRLFNEVAKTFGGPQVEVPNPPNPPAIN
jgi:mRNA-degrading endonuclease RelE of RelBE toxin-antitoxin system